MDYKKAVELALAGDEDGYKFLYDDTYKSKYYLALKYMKNEEAANDVVQDAYIKAFAKLDTLGEPEAFSGWLGTIVANTAKNALVKKNPTLFSDIAVDSEGESFEYQIEDESIESQPELSYTSQETQELTRELIDSLSDEQRMCILMFHIEGEPISVIAETLECSENTVKSRLNYGRKNLKAKAEELEKKGVKLYGLAPLPLLVYLLKGELSAIATNGAVSAGVATGVQSGAAKTGVAVATKTMPLITKILIGAIVAVVVGGGIILAVNSSTKPDSEPEQTPAIVESDEDVEDEPVVEDVSLNTYVTPALDGLVTTYDSNERAAMPSLSFDYPEGWTIDENPENANNSFSVVLTHPSGIGVSLWMVLGTAGIEYRSDLTMTKLADTQIENIIVARLDCDTQDSQYSHVLLRDANQGVGRELFSVGGDTQMLGFRVVDSSKEDMGHGGSFLDLDTDLSTEVYQEAISILASLRWTPAEPEASVTPQSENATQDWRDAYTQVLQAAPNQTYSDGNMMILEPSIRYALHDMNDDSIPELIMVINSNVADPSEGSLPEGMEMLSFRVSLIEIFSYNENTGAELIGESFYNMPNIMKNEIDNNLIISEFNSGNGTTEYFSVNMETGNQRGEGIYVGQTPMFDEIASFNEQHGLVGLEFSEAGDLALLSE